MVRKIDRTGEIGYTTSGEKIEIIEYKNFGNVKVKFQNGYIKKTTYQHFLEGYIKNPYRKKSFCDAYVGEGVYKASKRSKAYVKWNSMLNRCYNEKDLSLRKSYTGCQVEPKWLCFQNFAKWHFENYYELKNERVVLDKDIKSHNNKLYSEATCMYIPEKINQFVSTLNMEISSMVKRLPSGNYQSQKSLNGKQIYLGTFETYQQAYKVYYDEKKKHYKNMVLSYKGKIPQDVYDYLVDWDISEYSKANETTHREDK